MPDQPRGEAAVKKKDRDFAFQALLFEAEFSRPSIIVRNFEVYVQEYLKFKEHLTDTERCVNSTKLTLDAVSCKNSEKFW